MVKYLRISSYIRKLSFIICCVFNNKVNIGKIKPCDSILDCLPSLLGDGNKGTEIVYGGEKNILYWAYYRAAKAEQKSLVPARWAQGTNQGRSPHLFSLSPHSPQFQQSAGATPSLVSLILIAILYLIRQQFSSRSPARESSKRAWTVSGQKCGRKAAGRKKADGAQRDGRT
jgi:hypothetical protein